MKFSSIFYTINLEKTIILKPSFRLALQVPLYIGIIFSCVFSQRAFAQVANFGNLYIPSGGSVSVPVSFTNNAVANYVNDGTIILSGNITNNQPSLSPANGTTTLTGTALQTIGGTQPFYAHNFTLDKNNYTQLDASVFVNGILTLDNGILNTASDKFVDIAKHIVHCWFAQCKYFCKRPNGLADRCGQPI